MRQEINTFSPWIKKMSEEHHFPSAQSSPKARAYRLSILRKMAGLRLIELSQKYDIGYTTVRQWEKGQSPLSTRGAKLIVEAMRQEGIECTPSWLLLGSGNPPTYINQQTVTPLPGAPIVEQEIALFRNSHLNALILEIHDDAMHPFLSPGDRVGGVCLEKSEFDLMDGQYCIVESEADGCICRWTQKIPNTDLFNFQCLNLSTKLKNPVALKTNKIIKAAPMIRLWKQQKR